MAPDLPVETVSVLERLELPKVKPVVEQHRRLAVMCPGCQARVAAPRPAGAASTPFGPVIVELREWSRIGDDLRHDRNRLGNRVRELLWRYYPQMLELADDVAASWVLDLWKLIPTPEKVKKVR